jgi:o-succinylbenzoate synthase
MIKAKIIKRELQFISPGTTSRGTLYSKPSWYLLLEENGFTAVGECSVIPGLNPEYQPGFENHLEALVQKINAGSIPHLTELDHVPSIRFALETALINLNQKQPGILFPSAFTRGEKGIGINGLIWMGNKKEMQQQIAVKLNQGFKVLKLKVGALDFNEEIGLLKNIRQQFSASDLELRLDANGAFAPEQVLEKLKRLSDYTIHSIEQPIQAGQWDEMGRICLESPIPVALDEELIGIMDMEAKSKMLSTIQPQYIILKPSLTGGLDKSKVWIALAKTMNIGWWVTSALESNIGLNAIAQWTFTLNSENVQGLGTGQVFSNNIRSPLELRSSELFYNPEGKWEMEIATN